MHVLFPAPAFMMPTDYQSSGSLFISLFLCIYSSGYVLILLPEQIPIWNIAPTFAHFCDLLKLIMVPL